jgi:hypothetical protein
MKESTAEFVRKLRKVIRVLIWLWVIGSFVFFWIDERSLSQLRMPSGGTFAHPVTPSAEAIKAAKRMDWIEMLVAWAVYGLAPSVVLGVILYLIPGGRKKKPTPGDGTSMP